VLAVVEDPNATELSQDHIAAGILLAQHYAGEALRLAETVRLDPELNSGSARTKLVAERLVWSSYRPGRSVPARPAAIRDAKTARRITSLLEDHGWLRRTDGGYLLNGIPRKDVWRIWGKE
jgi:hypothetical protein